MVIDRIIKYQLMVQFGRVIIQYHADKCLLLCFKHFTTLVYHMSFGDVMSLRSFVTEAEESSSLLSIPYLRHIHAILCDVLPFGWSMTVPQTTIIWFPGLK